ncbi:MAG: FAD:protein FMN transferase [Ruminococcaceae bacterium]|nr:FAD:protein FMN transferase [Oscillospiraceae bacterium]
MYFKKIISSGLVFIFLFSMFSCGMVQKKYQEDSFLCMDTVVGIKIDCDDKEITKQCRELLEKLDKTFSDTDKKSVTYKYNESENGIEVPLELKELVLYSDEITRETNGAFSVFSGSLTSLWENSNKYPADSDIQNAVNSIPEEIVFNGDFLEKSNKDTKLEFGGIAKGYACDKAVELLKNNGVTSGMVSFTSSIAFFGKNPNDEPWKIAIKNPVDTRKVAGYVEMYEGYLSVSGDYERFFEIDGKKYNHIIDSKTGLPVDNGVHCVAVVTDSGAKSDALSTAFFVMGFEEVNKKYANSQEIKYLFITDDGIFMNKSMSKIFRTT